MLGLIEAFLLGVVQGLTEWLPISSSGHLVITKQILGVRAPLFFDVMLHVATLGVIFVFFRRELRQILRATAHLDFRSEDGRLLPLIIIGNIPVAVVGLTFYDWVTPLYTNPPAVGYALLMTGVILHLSRYTSSGRRLGYRESLIIGVAQAISLTPGISRSGLTIGVGLLARLDRRVAFRYSFLLVIPAVIGVALFEARNAVTSGVDFAAVVVGVIASSVVGYFSLKLVSRLVLSGRFHIFSYYCWVVGALTVLILS